MSEEVTSTEELENIIESTEPETAMVPSALTGIVDVSNLSIKEIAFKEYRRVQKRYYSHSSLCVN